MTRLFPAVGVVLLTLSIAQSASAARSERNVHPGPVMCATSGSHTATPAPRDEELPWCVSADDPRCAPLHHDTAPPQVGSRLPMAALADAPTRGDFATGHQAHTARAGLARNPGISHRVERPPRATGRSL